MTRQFADTEVELLQAVAQTAALMTGVLLFTTILAGARPYAPYAVGLLLLPLLYGSVLMRVTSLLLATAGLIGAYLSPLVAVVVTVLLAYFSGKAVWSPQHFGPHFTRLRHSLLFGQLGRALPGWQAFAPRTPGSAPYCRVLRSPAGRYYFVGVTAAREVRQYGEPTLVWNGVTQKNLRTFSAGEPDQLRRAGHVQWIVPPRKVRGTYPPEQQGGITTLYVAPAQLAAHLREWEEARQQNPGPQAKAQPAAASRPEPTPPPGGESVFAAEERRVLEEARAALASALPSGWVRADRDGPRVLLTAPGGTRFLVEVRGRRDRVVLQAGPGQHSWQNVHDALVAAAQGERAKAVLWQPTANVDTPAVVGQVQNVRGDVRVLLARLTHLAPPPAAPATPQAVSSDHELLGVPVGASREQIKAAYRQKIKVYHPDKMASLDDDFRRLAEEKSKRLNAAYQRLLARSA
ncbi:J domain-containing protein [Deinococcus aluminii]